MSTPYNEPAFPICGSLSDNQFNGMTLRDYFAAKAMQAEIITSTSDATPESVQALLDAADAAERTPQDQVAFHAYKWADAMLKARTP